MKSSDLDLTTSPRAGEESLGGACMLMKMSFDVEGPVDNEPGRSVCEGGR